MTTITSIAGNSQSLDGGAMFGNVPRALWEQWVEVDARHRIKLACRSLLIEHAGLRILCEVGIGAFFEPKLRERYGVRESEHVLLDSLAANGLGHQDIDLVILSHLHFDHAGGLLPAFGADASTPDGLLFPRARYVVGEKAWERAKNPHARDRASFIPDIINKLEKSGRLTIVRGTHLAGVCEDRLSFRFSDGHTPGQMHTVFRGERDTVVFAGDLVPGRAWVHLPVSMGYDRFPELVIDEKAALYGEALAGNWLLFFTHDIDCAAARLHSKQAGRFEPGESWPELKRFAL